MGLAHTDPFLLVLRQCNSAAGKTSRGTEPSTGGPSRKSECCRGRCNDVKQCGWLRGSRCDPWSVSACDQHLVRCRRGHLRACGGDFRRHSIAGRRFHRSSDLRRASTVVGYGSRPSAPSHWNACGVLDSDQLSSVAIAGLPAVTAVARSIDGGPVLLTTRACVVGWNLYRIPSYQSLDINWNHEDRWGRLVVDWRLFICCLPQS